MSDKFPPVAAIVLAAGKGVRMKSDLPKVLHEIDGLPMVCHVLNTLRKLNLKRIIVVVGYRKEQVIDALAGYNVEFIEQNVQLGTGHAVMMAEEALKDFPGDVLVLAGDVPFLGKRTLLNLMKEHYRRQAVATVLSSEPPDPTGYGRIVRDAQGMICGIVEHKDATEQQRAIGEINTGTYLFKRKQLFEALRLVRNDNVQGEFYLTDLMGIFLKQGQPTAVYKTEDYREALGINSMAQLEELKKAYHPDQ